MGDETQLVEKSTENHKGFWERRDVRQICDALLYAAGADWWKIANLNLDAIPHAALHEQRRKFQATISDLNQSPVWVLKEPRLCLLLPLLVDFIRQPTCIHVVRNPLEVAHSLRARNGFAIASGLALWEAYNLRALHSSATLPRIFVSYNSLISNPTGTLSQLVRNLHELSVAAIAQPCPRKVGGFLDSTLYRQKVSPKETEEHLSPSQLQLWHVLLSGDASSIPTPRQLSTVANRNLLDLESVELSLQHYQSKLGEYRKTLTKRTTTIERRDAQLEETRQALDWQKASLGEAKIRLQTQAGVLEARERKIDHLTSTLRDRDAQISAMRRSLSWKITKPLRAIGRQLAGAAKVPSSEAGERSDHTNSPLASSGCSSSAVSPSTEQPITTYVIPAAWWDAHPDAARDVAQSGQAIFLLGPTKTPIGKSVTRVAGPKARSLALAAVTTRTAIEVDADAEPSVVAWERWKSSAMRSEQRDDTNVRMRRAASLVEELLAEDASPSSS